MVFNLSEQKKEFEQQCSLLETLVSDLLSHPHILTKESKIYKRYQHLFEQAQTIAADQNRPTGTRKAQQIIQSLTDTLNHLFNINNNNEQAESKESESQQSIWQTDIDRAERLADISHTLQLTKLWDPAQFFDGPFIPKRNCPAKDIQTAGVTFADDDSTFLILEHLLLSPSKQGNINPNGLYKSTIYTDIPRITSNVLYDNAINKLQRLLENTEEAPQQVTNGSTHIQFEQLAPINSTLETFAHLYLQGTLEYVRTIISLRNSSTLPKQSNAEFYYTEGFISDKNNALLQLTGCYDRSGSLTNALNIITTSPGALRVTQKGINTHLKETLYIAENNISEIKNNEPPNSYFAEVKKHLPNASACRSKGDLLNKTVRIELYSGQVSTL